MEDVSIGTDEGWDLSELVDLQVFGRDFLGRTVEVESQRGSQVPEVGRSFESSRGKHCSILHEDNIWRSSITHSISTISSSMLFALATAIEEVSIEGLDKRRCEGERRVQRKREYEPLIAVLLELPANVYNFPKGAMFSFSEWNLGDGVDMFRGAFRGKKSRLYFVC